MSEPTFTAAVVGVGPIVSISDTPSSSVSSTSQSNIPVNSTYEAIERAIGIAKKKANRSDGALDVWYFVVPLEGFLAERGAVVLELQIDDLHDDHITSTGERVWRSSARTGMSCTGPSAPAAR